MRVTTPPSPAGLGKHGRAAVIKRVVSGHPEQLYHPAFNPEWLKISFVTAFASHIIRINIEKEMSPPPCC